MKTQFILILLLALAFARPLPARLGETPAECAARYGLRVDSSAPKAGFWDKEQCYEKNGIHLTIRFIPGPRGGLQAGYIEYHPVNRANQPLSAVHIRGLLDTVSTNWTLLESLPLPSAPTNAPAPSRTTLARSAKTKIITLEKTAGIEDKRIQKEQDERRAQLDAVNKHNREVSHLKDQISKLALPGTRFWKSETCLATSGNNSLTIVSADYVNAYTRQVAREINRKKTYEATPLKGF